MKTSIALYGLGTVGGALVEILRAHRAELDERHGIGLVVRHAVVRDPGRPRPVAVEPGVLTRDLAAPFEDPEVSIVVEAMGGLEPAGSVVREALRAGKSVVTANKALVAALGPELEALAAESGATLRYEAAVGGAIPVLHTLRGALAGDRIRCIRGILNGTTNYILTRMAEDRVPLGVALRRAQELGFAEADPGADLSGLDAAQKLVILARHAFGRWVPVDEVRIEGIEQVSSAEVEAARMRGGAVKLVAEARLGDDGEIELHVGPQPLDADDPLSRIRNEENAILLEAEFAGGVLLAGRGAGGYPTGSAVYSDLVEVAVSVAQRLAGRQEAPAYV